ncbi:MAG: flagellar protein FlaG [Candidatus Omnitrophota bacterium]
MDITPISNVDRLLSAAGADRRYRKTISSDSFDEAKSEAVLENRANPTFSNNENGGRRIPGNADPKPALEQNFQESNGAASRRLKFQVDKQTGRTAIMILDSKTNEVIREIPSEELREISEKLSRMRGFVIDGKA